MQEYCAAHRPDKADELWGGFVRGDNVDTFVALSKKLRDLPGEEDKQLQQELVDLVAKISR